jgi:hypothetical protein
VLVAVAAAAGLAPLLWLIPHSDVLSSFRAAVDQLPNTQRDPLTRPVLQLAAFLRWGLFALIGIALIAVAALRPRSRRAVAIGLIAVTAFDVVSFNRGFHPATPIAWADPPEPWLVDQLRSRLGHDRMGGNIEFQPNLTNRFQLREVRKYELPDLQRRYDLWTGLGGYQSGGQMELLPDETRAADMFSVRWVVSYALGQTHSARWAPTDVAPIVENRMALPRAWVAYRWRPAANEQEALALMVKGPDLDAKRAPVIEGAPPPDPAGESLRPSPARFETDGVTGMRLVVDAKRPARLVLNDTWYPGWHATVDGRDVKVEHANVAFRAVALPPGHHVVTFTYRPASVRIGEALTLIAALAIALALLGPTAIRTYQSRRLASRSRAVSADGRP